MRAMRAGLACLALMRAATGGALAQSEPSADELSKQLSNPVSDLASVPVQLNWENGVGPNDDLRFVTNVQPVAPFRLSPRWNLIGRMIVPFIQQPALTPGASPTSGTGDIQLSGFFSPAGGESGLTWGVGPILSLPTNTDPTLGSGKWGLGPTALVLVSAPTWTYGALVNHVWGVADTGDVERADLSSTFLQPFAARHFSGGRTLSFNSESTYNWEAESGEAWTVPLNAAALRFIVFSFTLASILSSVSRSRPDAMKR